jgi:hypothetical protein
MSNIKEAKAALLTRILEGTGHAPASLRRAAFNNVGLDGSVASLVAKIAIGATTVTDADIAAAEGTGLSEDQVYEIAVCAAVGQATRQQESALAALAAAIKE